MGKGMTPEQVGTWIGVWLAVLGTVGTAVLIFRLLF
jgi:hypothetical protein